MTETLRLCLAGMLCATPALAAPAHDVCIPNATGVPTREGPPKWVGTWTGSSAVDPSLDDPRWLGAVGHAFQFGSAKSPLQSRALFSNVGGQEYLYLSFIVDLESLQAGSQATPRDIFVGFHRANPDLKGTTSTADDEYGYIFQFHLMPGAAAAPYTPIAPVFCGDYDQPDCQDGSATEKDYWRVFVDRNETGTCSSGSPAGHQYKEWNGTDYKTAPTDLGWMADAVRYWKYDAAAAEPQHNRWAVQVRFPIVDATHPISQGIERGSTFWYQATATVTGTGGGPYANVGQWPTELTKSVCVKAGLPDKLIHEELGPADGVCLTCSVDKFSSLTDLTGPRPADCDGGITIEAGHVGSIFEVATGTDLTAVTPTNEFRALKPDGTPGTNTVIAQPGNTSSVASPPAPLSARFRLASWGSAPWSVPGDTGKWKDVRGSNGGVCASGTYPACAPVSIDPGHVAAIAFTWQIGNDATIGDSEYCKFALTPPASHGTMCEPIACDCAGAGAQCDTPTDAGVWSTKTGGGHWPCVSAVYRYDQCMLVELGTSSDGTSPSGGATFAQRSTWNNMTFGEMSILTREALIDARKLPAAPGQRFQDIYLVVMPRNMPESMPAGTTGLGLIQTNALDVALAVATPYIDDVNKIGEDGAKAIAERLRERAKVHRTVRARLPENNERVIQIRRAMEIMPDDDFVRVAGLLDIAFDPGTGAKPAAAVTHDAVTTLGPSTAAQVVPTLEIYPYYQPMGRGPSYEPMTSFSVFLSHESTLAGVHYEIDGAQRVGENVFRLQVPVGYAKRIQIRAQAIMPPELVERPGNPRWPCAGCCGAKNCGLVGGVGYFGPGLVAGVFVIRRRRRR